MVAILLIVKKREEMFHQLRKKQVFSTQQRRLAYLANGTKVDRNSRRAAESVLRIANERASRRGLGTIPIRRDMEKQAIDEELQRLAVVQSEAVQQDKAWRAAHSRQLGLPEDEGAVDEEDNEHTPENSQQPGKHLHYDDVNPATGNSMIQEWFDGLVRDAIVNHCPRGVSAVRTTELLKFIRKEYPSFSFQQHCDGVPFALLIKNCNYLNSFGGKVTFMPICQGDAMTGEDVADVGDDAQQAADVVIGLRKYKMREAGQVDGVRQGPQPWLFNGAMIQRRQKRRL